MSYLKQLPKILLVMMTVIILSSCRETVENTHLPEYCRTYAGFADVASRDLYALIATSTPERETINEDNFTQIINMTELVFEENTPDRNIDLGGIQCFQNLTSLTLIGQGFKDISEISALQNIQSLELRNTQVVSIDSFKNLSKISELILNNNAALQSVEGVEEMTKLTSLDLSDNGIVNIEGLDNLINLESLILRNNDIYELPAITQLYKLETLDVSNNNIQQFGDSLTGLSNLREFNAENNNICDLEPLGAMDSLRVLNLANNDLGCDLDGLGDGPNFSSLQNATELEELYLNDNNLTSIADLNDKVLPITTLHLHNNQLSDITPLSQFTSVTTLTLYNNNINNIGILSGMTGLTEIDLSDNNLTDFTELLDIPNLERVYLNGNEITHIPDLSPWSNLSVLDLHSNFNDLGPTLTDTSGVYGHQSLESLILYDNGLDTLIGISDIPNLDHLLIDTPDSESLPDDFTETHPNIITRIENSFNNLPELDMQALDESGEIIEGYFTFGFQTGIGLEIINSFKEVPNITVMDLSNMNIDHIDEQSIVIPTLETLLVNENNLTDIRFIYDNPELISIDASNNQITNLTEVTQADSLSHLIYFSAADNPLNDLDGAFENLENLEILDLNNTPLSTINQSFNNLSDLTALTVSLDQTTTITDAFNDIFTVYFDSNVITIETGIIESISNSFNNGQYDYILIDNNTPSTQTTDISGSFNDLSFNNDLGLQITDSHFDSMTDSFNRLNLTQLILRNNDTSTITSSFTDTQIEQTLDLSQNHLSNIPSINTVLSVDTIDISQNRLTTLTDFDSIPDLTTLDISTQYNEETLQHTLTIIDGINNLVSLTALSYNDLAITEITGLQNTALSSFQLNYANNNATPIITIGDNAFDGSPITTLDLGNHQITSSAFLSNLTHLEFLTIGLDYVDYSAFSGLAMASTLQSLVLQNTQTVSDLQPFEVYDQLIGLTYDNDATIIENLSGLDNLGIITLENSNNITTFTDSFNALPQVNLTTDYLTTYPNLTSITRSFDAYQSTPVEIPNTITIVDGFNQARDVILRAQGDPSSVLFDTDSFDSMVNLTIEEAAYNSYSFLDNYTTLDHLTISLLSANMTDLSNSTITALTIEDLDNTITELTTELNMSATLTLTGDVANTLTLTTNYQNYQLTMPTTTLLLSSTATTHVLNGDVADLTINNSALTALTFDQFTSVSSTFNADNLTTINTLDDTYNNATSLIVNSGIDTIDYTLQATNLTVVNNALTNGIVSNVAYNTTIETNQSSLTLNLLTDTLVLDNDTLTNGTFTGTVNTITVSSTNLQNLVLNDTSIAQLEVTSSHSDITISGTNVSNMQLSNDQLTNLSLDLPGSTVVINSNTSSAVSMSLNSNDLTLALLQAPTVELLSTSVIDTLTVNGDHVATLTLHDASISTLNYTTLESALTVTGSAVSTASIIAQQASTLTVTLPSSTLNITDSNNIATMTLDANTVNMTDTELTALTLNSTSRINTLLSLISPSLSSLDAVNIQVPSLTIDSNETTLDIAANNAISTVLTAPNITSLILDVGTNQVTIDADSTTNLSLQALANQLTLNSSVSTLTLDSASSINEFIIDSTSLSNISAFNANIDTISTSVTSPSLTMSGTNITTADISGEMTSFTGTLDQTNLTVTSVAQSPFDVTTDTENIVISALDDITLHSAVLNSAQVTSPTGDLTLDITTPAVTFNLTADVDTATFNTSHISGVTFGVDTTINTLNLTNTNIDTLFTGDAVTTLNVTTNQTSFTVGGTIESMTFTSPELSTLDVNSDDLSANLSITAETTSMTLTGTLPTVSVINDTMTTLDMTGMLTNDLTVDSASLQTLDTGSVALNNLELILNQDNYDITTASTTIALTGSSLDTGSLTVTSESPSVTTNIKSLNISSNVMTSLNITAPTTDLNVTGNLIASLIGEVSTLIIDTPVSLTSAIITPSITHLTGDTLTIQNGEDVDTLETDASTITVSASSNTSITLIGNSGSNTSITASQEITTLDVSLPNAGETTINASNAEVTMTGSNMTSVAGAMANLSVIDADNTLLTVNAAVTDIIISDNDILSAVTLTNNASNVDISSTTLDTLTISTTSLTLTINGSTTTLNITGTNLDTFNTENVSATTLSVLDTTYIDLSFMSTTVLNAVSTLTVNTLTVANIENIVTTLDGLTVELISPITQADVNNYYYQTEYNRLWGIENNDNVRYDNFYQEAVDNAYQVMVSNQYLDHIAEATLRNHIQNGYLTVDEYYQSYLDSEGLPTSPDEETIKASIQSTLDDEALTITEAEINAQVEISIVTDAETYRDTQEVNQTFTITLN
ncbi:MAG: hypothetical protein UMR38_02490 [Candidatus Izemoplasma sp.]|nr:hypothetical protein [Candidatus Izemoplasma sp.]